MNVFPDPAGPKTPIHVGVVAADAMRSSAISMTASSRSCSALSTLNRLPNLLAGHRESAFSGPIVTTCLASSAGSPVRLSNNDHLSPELILAEGMLAVVKRVSGVRFDMTSAIG